MIFENTAGLIFS